MFARCNRRIAADGEAKETTPNFLRPTRKTRRSKPPSSGKYPDRDVA